MNIFMARQPIFDRCQRVYAYELLFRSGFDNFFYHHNGNHASLQVINNSFFLIGMEAVTGGKRAFINFTSDLLLQEYATLLPPQLTAVEILETIEPNQDIITACQKLKQLGYLLALDDFVAYEEKWEPLIVLADIIKVDFRTIPFEERWALAQRFSTQRIKLLAEKVETREEFNQAVEIGYQYFQGYFFSKPIILSSKDVPGFKLNYLHILQEINQPELDFDRIEKVIKRDVSLSYKLLRYINSVAFGLRRTISSIKHALLLLGENAVRKWASLIVLTSIGMDKPMELVVNSLIRAKFCEALASKVGLREQEPDLFLMGLFSMIDALMDRPMSEILTDLPIAEAIKTALLGGKNCFRAIYETTLSYEKGEWQEFSEMTARLGVDETEIPKLYLQSVEWATQTFSLAC